MIFLTALLLHPVQPNDRLNWVAKPVPISQLAKRARFPVFLPSDPKIKMKAAWITWIPKSPMYPRLPARQAIRIHLVGEDSKEAELVLLPSAQNANESVFQVIGQGHLGVPYSMKKNGFHIDPRATYCAALFNSSFERDRGWEILKSLRAAKR